MKEGVREVREGRAMTEGRARKEINVSIDIGKGREGKGSRKGD